ncbi:hypothetical protein GN958_ATG23083 [Phytophthora infestans]|uniref:Uncharacterized protein n=1 Tax=Phytophthora infestans TaxID=4787 RepID=A0A8S9TLL5_PHYIN|nr:hypothetical protein GN958_ATG23083 [Phytophthora infestans]
MRKEGCSLSSHMLKFKVLEVAADGGLTRAILKASHSWRRQFMEGIDLHSVSAHHMARRPQWTL